MRYLYLFCLMFLAHSAWAFEVPEYMKDAEIVVKMKDGKTAKYSGNEWGVFKRHDPNAPKPKPKKPCPTTVCPTCPTCPTCPACEPKIIEREIVKVEKDHRKNAFSILAGYGPTGLLHKHMDDIVRVTPEYAVIGAVRYTRFFDGDYFLVPDEFSFEAATNFNFLIGPGWRF